MRQLLRIAEVRHRKIALTAVFKTVFDGFSRKTEEECHRTLKRQKSPILGLLGRSFVFSSLFS